MLVCFGQVIKKPEARALILAMTPVVVSEAMRTGLLCTRDFLWTSSSKHLRLPTWIPGLVALVALLWLALQMQSPVRV